MWNFNPSKSFIFLFLLFISFQGTSQVSESCNCSVDTLGYASFLATLSPDENATFQFHVSGTFAVAYGVIGSTTPAVVQDLINNYPAVTTIVMYACPGSEDDNANLQASLLLHNANYKMYLPVDGWVASGATDMFLAGSTRVVDATFDPVGVHSWSNGQNEATDFPVGHPFHQPYIDYYVNVGFTTQEAEDFYYFTIYAAPANGIHWMTNSEMNQYKIRTCIYSPSPNYSVSQNATTLTADLAGASYQWINCDNNQAISGETNQSYTPAQAGNYAVIVSESSCSDTSDCILFSPSVGIDESQFDYLSPYPNPTKYLINIPNAGSYNTIEFFNELGQTQTITMVQDKIDLTHLKKGVYFLKLTRSNGDSLIERIVLLDQE